MLLTSQSSIDSQHSDQQRWEEEEEGYPRSVHTPRSSVDSVLTAHGSEVKGTGNKAGKDDAIKGVYRLEVTFTILGGIYKHV